jgi:LysM repeat protein
VIKQKSLTNFLVAAAITLSIAVVYTSMIEKKSEGEKDATTKIAAYLVLDTVMQEDRELDPPDSIGAIAISNSTVTQANDSAQKSDQTEAVSGAPDARTETAGSESVTIADNALPDENVNGMQQEQGFSETIYVVQKGDTYGCIAERHYGSHHHYQEVMAANPITKKGFSERKLFVGAKVVLPAIAAQDLKQTTNLCS